MTFRPLALAALLAATAGTASAERLAPLEAKSIDLGGLYGVVYYVERPDGFHVVATLAEGEQGLPIRFEATLADSQKLTISVPGKPGEVPRIVEFSRADDRLLVDSDRSVGSLWPRQRFRLGLRGSLNRKGREP